MECQELQPMGIHAHNYCFFYRLGMEGVSGVSGVSGTPFCICFTKVLLTPPKSGAKNRGCQAGGFFWQIGCYQVPNPITLATPILNINILFARFHGVR